MQTTLLTNKGLALWRGSGRMLTLLRWLFFCGCFVFGWPPASAQVADLLKTPPAQRLARLNHFFTWQAGDSAAGEKAADSIYKLAKKQGDERLVLYTRLMVADRNDRQQAGALPTTFLRKDSAEFSQSPFPDVRASFHLYAALLYYRRQQHENMFYHLITAINQFEKIGWKEVPLATTFANHIFEIYYRFGDYRSALKFLQVAIAHADPWQWSPIYTLNNMGVTHLKLKDLDKAKEVFLKVIAQAKRDGDTAYLGIGSGNYGNALRLQERYSEALPYLYTDVALNEKAVPENTALTCAYIADCLLQLDSVDKAGFYLTKAAELRYESNLGAFFPSYFDAMAQWFKKQGNFRQALLYKDSLIRVNETMRETYNTALLLTTSLTLKEERRLAEMAQQELRAANLRLTRNVTIGALVFFFAAIFVALQRKSRRERQQLLAKQQQAEEKLQQAEQELARYIETIRDKNRLIERIESQLDLYTADNSSKESTEKVQTAFEGLSLLTDADWNQFRSLFSAVHPRFLPNLESRHPGLSPAETRLLVLQKLQLSSKEMAAMLGISLESLRKSRYRLRKKYPELMESDE